MASVGVTRRALLGSAAAAGMVAATPWPLRALAQSASGNDLATEWPALAQRQLDPLDADPG